jgi:hypothetical protein
LAGGPGQVAQRFYSIPAQIRQKRYACHGILEITQQGDLDTTPWMERFRAFDGAMTTTLRSLRKLQ